MNVFIINGGQTFAHSGGMFNNTLTGWTVEVMKEKGFAYRVTNINEFQMGGRHHLPHPDLVVPAAQRDEAIHRRGVYRRTR